jgi:hypothetical protein
MRKATISFVMSVCLSSWNNSAPTEWIFMKFYVLSVIFTLDAGLLARSQYPEGPKTGLLDTGFLGFPGSKRKC